MMHRLHEMEQAVSPLCPLRGGGVVDGRMRSSDPKIPAIGEVASYEGMCFGLPFTGAADKLNSRCKLPLGPCCAHNLRDVRKITWREGPSGFGGDGGRRKLLRRRRLRWGEKFAMGVLGHTEPKGNKETKFFLKKQAVLGMI